MVKLYQGFFKPKNPQKYHGNVNNIVYRSGWELKLMTYLDRHPDVLKWGSEEIAIPYRSPLDGRIHRYFPDFLVVKINKGKKQTVMIEVKPERQTKPPVLKGKKRSKRLIQEAMTYEINEAKWKAAMEVCADRGWVFQIMTEKELGIK